MSLARRDGVEFPTLFYTIIQYSPSHTQKKVGKEVFEVKKSFSFSLEKIFMGTRSRAQSLVPLLLALVAWLDFNSKSN